MTNRCTLAGIVAGLAAGLMLASLADAGPRSRRSSSACVGGSCAVASSPVTLAEAPVDALEELNANRAGVGLAPFIRDPDLTTAALAAAKYRADRRIVGHYDDFAFLPVGAVADSAGCAAWPIGMRTTDGFTFGSCNDNATGYTHAGAAYSIAGGTRFMHLFVARRARSVTTETFTVSTTTPTTAPMQAKEPPKVIVAPPIIVTPAAPSAVTQTTRIRQRTTISAGCAGRAGLLTRFKGRRGCGG